MSIAICALLRPSPCLRVLLLTHALGAFAIALLQSGLLQLPDLPGSGDIAAPRYAMPWLGAAVTLLSGSVFALLFCRSAGAPRIAAQLDIWGVGQLWLTVYLHTRRTPDGRARWQPPRRSEPQPQPQSPVQPQSPSQQSQLQQSQLQLQPQSPLQPQSQSPSACTVVLDAGSTLWPGFLLLRLRDANGRRSAWPVCRSGVAGDAYRPLSVACRVIAVRGGEHE